MPNGVKCQRVKTLLNITIIIIIIVIIIIVVLISGVVAVCGSGTNTTIGHCEKCVDPELECDECPEGHIKSKDKKACIGQCTCYFYRATH